MQFNENGRSKLDMRASASVPRAWHQCAMKDIRHQHRNRGEGFKSATDELRSQAATFGSNLSVVQNRQDFTKGMVDILTAGADGLPLRTRTRKARTCWRFRPAPSSLRPPSRWLLRRIRRFFASSDQKHSYLRFSQTRPRKWPGLFSLVRGLSGRAPVGTINLA